MIQPPTQSKRSASTRPSRRGSVLLEVILSIALFVAAAGTLYAAIASSLRAVQRVRVETMASDLAVTVLSEIHMGLREPASEGPEAFVDPLEGVEDERLTGWTWEITAEEITSDDQELPGMTQVTVTIVHTETGKGCTLVELFPPQIEEEME
jgi:hypothetical protein